MSASQQQTADSLHLVRAKILAGEVPSVEQMAELIRRIVKRWPFEVSMEDLFAGKGVKPAAL